MKFERHDFIKDSIAQVIKSHADSIYHSELDLSALYQNLTTPPDRKMGDLAFAAFPLAKMLKSSPVQIAKDLEQAIEPEGLIQKAVATGPYLNLTLNYQKLASTLLTEIN